jgi:hypothetical protein
VVARLDDDDVGAEVRPEQEGDGSDQVWLLGLATGKRQLRELLVGLKHDQVWAEDNAGLLRAVVSVLKKRFFFVNDVPDKYTTSL